MNAAPLCSLATVSTGGKAHINHMYFAWSGWFDVYWISDPDSIHSRNLLKNGTAAVTVYDSRQVWGKPDRGIQLSVQPAWSLAGRPARPQVHMRNASKTSTRIPPTCPTTGSAHAR
jgi:hypothetical protein